jgi:hypothetical protein
MAPGKLMRSRVAIEAERRVLKYDVTLRAASAGKAKQLVGYAATYNTRTVIPTQGGSFVEQIAPGAFRSVLADPGLDCIATYNHLETLLPLGRTSSGTLRLSEDRKGLAFEIDLPDSQFADELHSSVARKDIQGCSFAFTVGPDDQTWNDEVIEGRNTPVRTLTNIKQLFDITVCPRPAYKDGTSVAARGEVNTALPERRFTIYTGRTGGFSVDQERMAVWHYRKGHGTLQEMRAKARAVGVEIVRRRKALLNSILNS